MAGGRTTAWAQVLRSALLFTPFLAVTLVALAFIVADIASDGMTAGRIVGIVLVSSVTLLLAYQVVQSLRDLVAQTVETRGLVERTWTRNDFFLFRNTYVFVDRNVYRVPPELGRQIEPGDAVRIVHYPHTGTVEAIEVVTHPAASEA
ncbi:MAG: hypothetical protein WD939_05920 [Dehalococcoidia bacterium]